jgi:hypothetical protein
MNYLRIFSGLLLFTVLTNADTECSTTPSISSDRRSNSKSLRIVQYNTEWLFIDYYSNSDCPGNGCTWKNASEAKTHLSYVSNVIKPMKI